MPVEPAPIVIDPSGDFLGVDGAWSTFSISAGTPPQRVQVLASTEVASTWVVAPQGCGPNDAANCTQARGGEYDDSKSSTWNVKGIYQLGVEANLGYTGNAINGSYGYDTIGLPGLPGTANITVTHQVIAGVITEVFYVGSLGLSSQAINFTSSSDTSPSLLTSLKNEKLIPSLSYGYTAGASYQPNGGVTASLTLGGYDASRFIPNEISFTFAPTIIRQLVVAIPSITFSTSKTQTPLLNQPIMALIDSTVPYLWLPQDACQLFETAFGISWDPLRNLYLVNDTLHDTLVKENPSVVFTLANSLNGPSVNITLPYASFDLVANYPLVKNQSRYFPLQRAADDNSYTLGRTFLQESFLIVNYEHSNFSISQAKFDPSTPTHIVPLLSTDTTATPPSNPSATSPSIVKSPANSSHSIGTGAIAGIAIAIVLIAALVGAFFIRKMYRKKRDRKADLPHEEPKVIADMLDMQKRDSSEDPEVEFKKTTTVTIAPTENPMTPLSEMEGMGYFGPNAIRPQSRMIELPGSPGNRSELSSPELVARSEAPSPDPENIRSELSTPEPMYSNPELPTPDPSHELASPSVSAASSGHPSPSLDGQHSAFKSPLPIQRHFSGRTDSSESDTGFSRDGMPRRLPFHRHYHSDESDAPSRQPRPPNPRMNSSDSANGFANPNRPRNILTRPIGITHLDSATSDPDTITQANTTLLDSSTSDSDGPLSSPFANRARIPTHLESSSESESSPITPPARQVQIIASTFHSSNSSRPAIRPYTATSSPRGTAPPPPPPPPPPPVRRPVPARPMQRMDSTDSEPWETRLESPSTEGASDISRFNSLRNSLRRR